MQLNHFSKFILTTTLILMVACISGCGPVIDIPLGSLPSANLSLSSLAFGSIASGTSSSTQTVTISNTGNVPLAISNIGVSGINAKSFSQSNNCSTNLPADSSCTITANFSPAIEGSYTAAITITDNAPLLIQTIALSGSATSIAASPVAVRVGSATTALRGGQAAQFAAIVSNSANQTVTWSSSPAGVGSINTSGLYTAPVNISVLQTVTIIATSQADPTAFASTTITLLSSITVIVSPGSESLNSGGSTQLTATVTGTLNSSVTWTAVLGSITQEGLYTAPSNTGSGMLTDTITAMSFQYPTESATATITVSSGLVGWWPLDEGTGLVAQDISGQGNNGLWSGAPSSPKDTYYTTGLIGTYAGYFDGSDNQLTIGTPPVYQFTGPFTASAWVNTVSGGTILSMQNGGDNGYNLAIIYGVIRFCVYTNATEHCTGGGRYPLSSPAWVDFTAVFDGSSISVYANGVFVASSQAANPTASTGSLMFGLAQRGGYSDFAGSIDDIRIYNRSLSANEISSLYNSDVGIPNAPTRLQAYPGDSEVGISWNAPTSGSTLTGYVVDYRQHNTSTWSTISRPASTATSLTVTDLTNGIS